jgi:DNA polymerase III epsilon subunit-like protein
MGHRIFADVETTGLKSYTSHVVEAALVVLGDDLEEVDHFHTLSNPGEEALRQASPEALRVNRIVPEDLRAAPPAADAARALQGFMARYPGPIHAFNNDFDLWFLAREPWRVPSRQWGACVMLSAMEVMEKAGALERRFDGSPKWPRLAEAAQFFGIPVDGSHRALDDARTASRIHAAILRLRGEQELQDEARALIDDGF